ncbi:MAG: TonB-dependent receptor plug domain-containing protein, partial [Bacteroidota bacterium]
MRKIASLLLLLFTCALVYAQQKTVTGTITGEDGKPLSGATVSAKGSTESTLTDAGGKFSLNVSDKVKSVIISYVGLGTQEVSIGSGNISAQLKAKASEVGEVVVVGYGTKLKKDVTSSISKVTAKEFQNLPLPSFEQALQGRAAGVFINTGSGKLGQGLNVRVRGISSISANQQPFVVIDGVPVVNQSLGSATEPDNPLATLNPDDIESIEVLKDAASSAIYGSRASNGVLLITTKSGKKGRTKLNLG